MGKKYKSGLLYMIHVHMYMYFVNSDEGIP